MKKVIASIAAIATAIVMLPSTVGKTRAARADEYVIEVNNQQDENTYTNDNVIDLTSGTNNNATISYTDETTESVDTENSDFEVITEDSDDEEYYEDEFPYEYEGENSYGEDYYEGDYSYGDGNETYEGEYNYTPEVSTPSDYTYYDYNDYSNNYTSTSYTNVTPEYNYDNLSSTIPVVDYNRINENKVTNSTINEESIQKLIGSTVMLKKDAPIYSNYEDAYKGTNPQTRYYSTDEPRVILSIIFWNDKTGGCIVDAYNKNARAETIRNLNNNSKIVAVLTAAKRNLPSYNGNRPLTISEFNTSIEGWANVNDIDVKDIENFAENRYERGGRSR